MVISLRDNFQLSVSTAGLLKGAGVSTVLAILFLAGYFRPWSFGGGGGHCPVAPGPLASNTLPNGTIGTPAGRSGAR